MVASMVAISRLVNWSVLYMATLPPLDLSTAKVNPKFEALYISLATNILNPDGSVKVSTQDAERQSSTREVLAPCRPRTMTMPSDGGRNLVGASECTVCCCEDSNNQIHSRTAL